MFQVWEQTLALLATSDNGELQWLVSSTTRFGQSSFVPWMVLRRYVTSEHMTDVCMEVGVDLRHGS